MVSESRKQYQSRRNKQRRIARRIVHEDIGTDVFHAAQGFVCGICMKPLARNDMSVDHVRNFAWFQKHAGNLLLVHALCNQEKDDRHPTDAELRMLGVVNACLGYRKGIYKAAQPWKGAQLYGAPKELLPCDFFFKMLQLLYIKVMLRS